MKFIPAILLVLISIISSCNKEDTATPFLQSNEGVIQKLLKDSSSVFVLDRKDYNNSNMYPTTSLDVGFIFKPTKEITLVSVGCKAQEAAEYQVIIRKFHPVTRVILDTTLIETVKVLNDADFFYKDINKQIVLSKDFEYAIYYFNKSIKSVWNAVYTRSGAPINAPYIFPMVRDNVILKENFSIYYNGSFLYQYNIFSGNGLRGLVDFKYK